MGFAGASCEDKGWILAQGKAVAALVVVFWSVRDLLVVVFTCLFLESLGGRDLGIDE